MWEAALVLQKTLVMWQAVGLGGSFGRMGSCVGRVGGCVGRCADHECFECFTDDSQ